MSDKELNIALHNNTSAKQLEARKELSRLFAERPFPDEYLLTNFGLFARSSALAKIFFLHEAYRLVRSLPGDIYVFGVWLGQDVVVFESLRAMLEPYNASRKIIGFDTFEGYASISKDDRVSDVVKTDGYTVPTDYVAYLESLLAYHRSENAMGHAVTHRLVVGDITKTAVEYMDAHPESQVALAYFDLALYEPTTAALDAISDRLMPGSVIVFDELNDPRYPGETKAFRDWAKGRSYEIRRSEVLPDRSFVILK
jgi:hypothetical protein